MIKLKLKKLIEFLKYGKVKLEKPILGITSSYSCSSSPSISSSTTYSSSVQTSNGSWTFVTSEGQSYPYDIGRQRCESR